MDNKEEQEQLILETPDANSIPCLRCKWGQHNYLAMYCLKYSKKPDDVYYENAKCPHFEEIKKI